MDVVLRAARPDDYGAFARWFPLLETGDPVPSRERWSSNLAMCSSLALVDGKPAGYCFSQSFTHDGYVRHLVVDPAFRGCGIGRRLMLREAEAMRARGCTRWRLNVVPDNTPAAELYRSLGMRHSHDAVSLRFDWDFVERLAHTDARYSLVPLNPERTSAVEACFDLYEGQLDALNARMEVVVRVLVDAHDPTRRDLGVIAFDTSFPGCFPFRAQSIEGACAMLRGVRSMATQHKIGVVVEDHPELDAYFVGAGARVAFRFTHMIGPIPPL